MRTLNTALTLAGWATANKGMNIIICCELESVHISCKIPARIAFNTTLFKKFYVSTVSNVTVKSLKNSASYSLTNYGGISFSIIV